MTLPKGRAVTVDDKRRVMKRILAAWLANPDLRLGQFITCSIYVGKDGSGIFCIEDEELAEACERRRT